MSDIIKPAWMLGEDNTEGPEDLALGCSFTAHVGSKTRQGETYVVVMNNGVFLYGKYLYHNLTAGQIYAFEFDHRGLQIQPVGAEDFQAVEDAALGKTRKH